MNKGERLPFFNFQSVGLFSLALVMNLVALVFVHNKPSETYFCNYRFHNDVAYNVWKNNSVKINNERIGYVQSMLPHYRPPDYSLVRGIDFKGPDTRLTIQDTPGYGILMGLLWKLTNSLSALDLQILQIFMYSCMMFLLFQISMLMFKQKQAAFVACLAHLFFYPLLIFLNVQSLRDVWAYYGSVVLLYAALRYLVGNMHWFFLIPSGFIVALCQFIRPTLFPAVFTVLGAATVGALFKVFTTRKALTVIGVLLITNVVGFWIPFVSYNKTMHGRWRAGPFGEGFLSSLADQPNPWNASLWRINKFFDLVEDDHGLIYGTQEWDDMAGKIFREKFKENPSFYFQSVLKRIPRALLPVVPWFHDAWKKKEGAFFQNRRTMWDKIPLLPRGLFWLVAVPALMICFLCMFLGYAGLFLTLYRREWASLLLSLSIIVSQWGLILTHVELRYLIPFYWPFALFAGYFFVELLAGIRHFVSRTERSLGVSGVRTENVCATPLAAKGPHNID